jgi:transcriptional regulator with XRE-family HTH domain
VSKEIGSTIRSIRQQLKLTAADLGRRSRIDPAALLRIERGENTNPSFATIARIADALGVPLETFRPTRSAKLRTGDVERIRREEELREIAQLSAQITKRLQRIADS